MTSAHKPPLTRRAALSRAISAIPALAVGSATALAAAASSPDAEVLALGAEVERLNAQARAIEKARIDPFTEEFLRIVRSGPGGHGADGPYERASAFDRECGRAAALVDQAEVYARADSAYERMIAIPAKSQAGRVAKVRAFIRHVGGDDWRGDINGLEWVDGQARALMGELAGMSPEELAAI